ncbi:MAG: hypothetical protein ACRDD7_01315 [Peptostreptococcaceae bacterium]
MEIKINAMQAIQILRVVNQLGIKDEIKDIINKFLDKQDKEQKIYRKLNLAIEDNVTEAERTLILQKKLMEESKDTIELNKINREFKSDGISLLIDVLTRIPQAEVELFKLLANIMKKTVEEVQEMSIDEIINCVFAISKNSEVVKLFT